MMLEILLLMIEDMLLLLMIEDMFVFINTLNSLKHGHNLVAILMEKLLKIVLDIQLH